MPADELGIDTFIILNEAAHENKPKTRSLSVVTVDER